MKNTSTKHRRIPRFIHISIYVFTFSTRICYFYLIFYESTFSTKIITFFRFESKRYLLVLTELGRFFNVSLVEFNLRFFCS